MHDIELCLRNRLSPLLTHPAHTHNIHTLFLSNALPGDITQRVYIATNKFRVRTRAFIHNRKVDIKFCSYQNTQSLRGIGNVVFSLHSPSYVVYDSKILIILYEFCLGNVSIYWTNFVKTTGIGNWLNEISLSGNGA